MSDRLFVKAQSEGWTDLFLNDGKVWGYRDPADVMPLPYPEQPQKSCHAQRGVGDPSYGFSCPAILTVDDVLINGVYEKEPSGYFLRYEENPAFLEFRRAISIGSGLSSFSFRTNSVVVLSALKSRPSFDGLLALQIPEQYAQCVEWRIASVSCYLINLEAVCANDKAEVKGGIRLVNVRPVPTHTQDNLTAFDSSQPTQEN